MSSLSSETFQSEFAAALAAEPKPRKHVAPAPPKVTAKPPAPPILAPVNKPSVLRETALPPVIEKPVIPSVLPAATEAGPANVFTASRAALATLCHASPVQKTWRSFPIWGSGVLVVLLVILGCVLFAPPERTEPKEQTLALAVPEAPKKIEHRDVVQAPLPVTPPRKTEDSEQLLAPRMARQAGESIPVAEVLAGSQRAASAKEAPLLAANPRVVRLEEAPAIVPQQELPFAGPVPPPLPMPPGEMPSLDSPVATPEQAAKAADVTEKPAESSFYGIREQGTRICYVVDNSASMRGTRFEAAMAELKKSVENLKPEQYFYVVFFSDGAYPLFFPKQVITMIPATDENKALFREWLTHVALGPATKGSTAMKIALDLEPNIIYMLGDGEFQDNTVSEVVGAAKKPYLKETKLHCVGFDIPGYSKADYGFAAMAKAFGGTYKNLRVAP